MSGRAAQRRLLREYARCQAAVLLDEINEHLGMVDALDTLAADDERLKEGAYLVGLDRLATLALRRLKHSKPKSKPAVAKTDDQQAALRAVVARTGGTYRAEHL